MSELLSAPVEAEGLSAAELLPEETVRAIADEIWASFIGEEEFLLPLEGDLPEQAVSSWVGIDGPWRGRVALTCSTGAAEELTRALLRDHSHIPLGAEDIEDGFGELVNVLGGGLKALLPEASTLTLPMVGPQPPSNGTNPHVITSLWRGERVDIVICDVPLPH